MSGRLVASISYVGQRVEPVQLGQELHQRALHLAVPGRGYVEALGPDRIQFVDEHDGWCLVLGQLEQFPDQPGALSDVLLDQLRIPTMRMKVAFVWCATALASSVFRFRRPDQEHALWRLYPHPLIQFGPEQGVFHCLSDLDDLLLEAAHIISRIWRASR